MNKSNRYSNYFKNQYKLKYSPRTVDIYRRWFYAQWCEILRLVKLKKTARVLEIGSGVGILYSFLKEFGLSKYLGLELDNEAVIFSNKYFAVNLFSNNTIENFKTKQKFDYIFAFEVLEHLEDPDRVIKRIYQLLERNGHFIGTSPFPFLKNIDADETHKYVLHPETWKNLFKKNKFLKVETYPMSFFPFIWRLNKYFNVKIPFYIHFKGFISTALIIAQK